MTKRTCLTLVLRCHWSCAGLLKTDDAEGFQDWQCPDCQNAKKIGTWLYSMQVTTSLLDTILPFDNHHRPSSHRIGDGHLCDA